MQIVTKCKNCGEQYKADLESIANVECPYCGYALKQAQNEKVFSVSDGCLCSYNGKEQLVIVPDDVTEICPEAFANNTRIRIVVINENTTKIGERAFAGCSNLFAVVLPDGVEETGESAFEGSGLVEIKLPGSFAEIPDAAFRNCTALKNVVFPWGLKKIGEEAFVSCVNLTNVQILDSVEEISRCAFYGCSSLGKVSLTDSVEVIGDYAFANCNATIYVSDASKPGWSECAFEGDDVVVKEEYDGEEFSIYKEAEEDAEDDEEVEYDEDETKEQSQDDAQGDPKYKLIWKELEDYRSGKKAEIERKNAQFGGCENFEWNNSDAIRVYNACDYKIYMIKGGDIILDENTVIKKKDIKIVYFKYAGLFSLGYIKFNRNGDYIYFKKRQEDNMYDLSYMLKINGVEVEYIV